MENCDHKDDCKCKKSPIFWGGFFLGGIIGAVVIFLLGTKEGKKVAGEIVDKAEEYEEELEKKVARLEKKGEEIVAEAEKIKEKVMKDVEKGKKVASEQMLDQLDGTLSKIEGLQKKGVALTEEVHRRYFKKNGKALSS